MRRLVISGLLLVGLLGCGEEAASGGESSDAGGGANDSVSGSDSEAVADAVSGVDAIVGDVSGPAKPKATFPYGAACSDDSACLGMGSDGGAIVGVCLKDLPGGYCATACGPDKACLDGGACVPRHTGGATKWVCIRTCGDKSHCRTKDAYTCDRDRTCWPIPKLPALNNRPIGAPCWTDSQCGTKRCNRPLSFNKATGYIGGACGKKDCKKSPCPTGAKCLNLSNGGSACFPACKSAGDCRKGYRCVAGGCAPGCAADTDCPDKNVCTNKRCASAFFACSTTNPAGWCPGTAHCDDGVCKTGKLSCGGGVVDPFEPNDTREKATKLSRERTFGGQICAGDGDWFELTAPAGVLTEVTLDFAHPAGDLDLLVHDDKGLFVRSRYKDYPYKGKLWADFDKSGESVAFYHPTKPQTVFLKVVGATPNVANSYGIIVRHMPYADGVRCTDKRDADVCRGIPDGILSLIHFPEPIVGDKGGAGAYRFGSVSGYKWSRLELVMLVRHALGRIRESFPDSAPVEFADISQHDGVTPGYDIGKPRHCHTCHDQGGNIDIAYFQKNNDHGLRPICGPTKGKQTQHYNPTKKECTNGALAGHVVDVDQQVMFMAALFDDPRTRAIGVDPVIGKVLRARAQELYDTGLITAAGNLGIQKKTGLWATHHDHIHVSMKWW